MAVSVNQPTSNKTALEIQREQGFNDFLLEYVLKSDTHDLYVSKGSSGHSKWSYYFAPKNEASEATT